MDQLPVGSLVFVCNVCNASSASQEVMTQHVHQNHVFENNYDALHSVTSYLIEPAPCETVESQTNLEEADETTTETDVTETSSAPRDETKIDSKLWSNNTTVSLITLVKEYDLDFQNKMKKTVWKKIAGLLNSKFGTNKYSGVQCDTKWKGLQRTYKDIKDHNSTSGKDRKKWEFFDTMNDILHKKPEIQPAATCSSHMGLISGPTITAKDAIPKNLVKDVSSDESQQSNTTIYESGFIKKRKASLNHIERRHLERMTRTDRFLDTFDKLVEDIVQKKKKKDQPDDETA